MIHDEWMVTRGMRASASEKELFEDWTDYLPVRTNTTPFHSGPHSIKWFRAALSLASREWGEYSMEVLETGFCLGHSATIMLKLGASSVTSIDNSTRPLTEQAAALVREKFNDRFEFIRGDALKWPEPIQLHLRGKHFDFMFIDGGHMLEDVEADFKLGRKLGIRTFLFDDFFPHWGPGVQPVIQKYDLLPVAILGTMALCTFPES